MSGCCGLGTCTNPTCYLCTVIAKQPQPKTLHEPDHQHIAPDGARSKSRRPRHQPQDILSDED